MESLIWTGLTYYTIRFAPTPSRFFGQLLVFVAVHQMALSLFRLIGVVGRRIVGVSTLAAFILVIVFVLGGFIIDKGKVLLESRAIVPEEYMYWICVAALFAFSIFFTICFTVALAYLNPFGDGTSLTVIEESERLKEKHSTYRKRPPTNSV